MWLRKFKNVLVNYVLKHWRGELPLAISFWVNFILLIAGWNLLALLITKIIRIENPQYVFRLTTIFVAILIIITPWMIVGVWRACRRHKNQIGKTFWARMLRGFVIFILILFMAAFFSNWPLYKDLYNAGWVNEFDDYTLELENNNTLICLRGGLGFGVSKEVEKLLRQHPEIRGIVLDSYGGKAYEGQQLAKLIISYGLNTYSFEGCNSAAATAFIAGNKRFLGIEARLGFHQPSLPYKNLSKYMDLKKINQDDVLLFKHQGVKQEFLDKLLNAPSDGLWRPSIDELLSAGVIHGVVDPCEILEANALKSADVNTTTTTDDITSAVASEANKPATLSPKLENDANAALYIDKLKKEAEAGDVNSQFQLGRCYWKGKGVEQDYKEAVKWLRNAAEQGNANAQDYLGGCYEFGLGVEQDYKEAAKWLHKAAEQGTAVAQSQLGACYVNGQGVEQDYKEGVKWYRKAAEQGHAYAQGYLGYCYAKGQGVDRDDEEAVKWYRKGAEQRDAYAQYSLGACYSNGRGVEKDYKEAVKWYRKAAEQGFAEAQYSLGLCYDNGRGVKKDYKAAVKWYRKAAEQGISEAQHNLGCCYATGRGVKEDGKEAVKWYRKAAEQGAAKAQNSLGACYADGQGVVQDYVEAYKWFLIAETTDHDVSKNKKIIAPKMTKEQIAEAEKRAKEFISRQK